MKREPVSVEGEQCSQQLEFGTELARHRDGVSFFSRGVGAVLSAACASYLRSRGERWGLRRVARRERRKAMKLGVEYGEDAAAHDRGALEGGGGAKHEGDENTLHIYMCWGC